MEDPTGALPPGETPLSNRSPWWSATTAPIRRSTLSTAPSRSCTGRDGSMQVVFVTHVPGTAAMSGQALVEVRDGLDQQATILAHRVAELLEGSGIRWQFQRREGNVADELMAVADEQVRGQGPDCDVVIIVGGPSHWYHHVAGSVPSVIARRDRFPLLIEP